MSELTESCKYIKLEGQDHDEMSERMSVDGKEILKKDQTLQGDLDSAGYSTDVNNSNRYAKKTSYIELRSKIPFLSNHQKDILVERYKIGHSIICH